MNEKDTKIKYADIIRLPHHQSPTRPHMPLYDRAAQFAPFAALTGYDDMVAEEARLTDSEIELSDSEIAMIGDIIAQIGAMIEDGAHPAVSVTYFKPDAHKAGGRYEKMTGVVKRVDPIEKRLVFYGSEDTEDKRIPTVEIPMEKIIAVSLNLPNDSRIL